MRLKRSHQQNSNLIVSDPVSALVWWVLIDTNRLPSSKALCVYQKCICLEVFAEMGALWDRVSLFGTDYLQSWESWEFFDTRISSRVDRKWENKLSGASKTLLSPPPFDDSKISWNWSSKVNELSEKIDSDEKILSLKSTYSFFSHFGVMIESLAKVWDRLGL